MIEEIAAKSFDETLQGVDKRCSSDSLPIRTIITQPVALKRGWTKLEALKDDYI